MKNKNVLKNLVLIISFAGLLIHLNAQSNSVELTGSGATFPEPLYKKMFSEYNKKTGVKVNYQGIGSGGGIKQLTEKVTDFGGTDAFMNENELKTAGADIIHIPTCIGAVTIVYNLPGIKSGVRLTPELLAGIFLGNITEWNDPKIATVNNTVRFPKMKISVVHRSDSSGTSFVFTEYLTKVNAEWKGKVGANKSPNWPAGIGGKGNPGVADLVSKIPGSIGYVELAYALQNKMSYAQVKNKKGNYISPDLSSVSAAADIALPNDLRISITDTDAAEGYPISSFTWIILYKNQGYYNRALASAKSTVNMIWWVIHDGQMYNEALDYAKLPKSAVIIAEKLLKSVSYNGQTLVK